MLMLPRVLRKGMGPNQTAESIENVFRLTNVVLVGQKGHWRLGQFGAALTLIRVLASMMASASSSPSLRRPTRTQSQWPTPSTRRFRAPRVSEWSAPSAELISLMPQLRPSCHKLPSGCSRSDKGRHSLRCAALQAAGDRLGIEAGYPAAFGARQE